MNMTNTPQISKPPQRMYVKEKDEDENGDDKYVELDIFLYHNRPDTVGIMPKEGYWKVSKFGNGAESRLITHLTDDIPLYPFLNVEKYRNTIIDTLSVSFGKNMTLANIADNIISAIAEKLRNELDNRTISKEDFYD